MYRVKELFLFDILVVILKIEETIKNFDDGNHLKYNYMAWDSVIGEIKEVLEFTEQLFDKVCTILEMVKVFEKALGKKVPYKIAPRRAGDIATCFADSIYAKKVLNLEATKGIDEVCKDSWRW
jgi:nucleoside-diphosphate-sugar epimerase